MRQSIYTGLQTVGVYFVTRDFVVVLGGLPQNAAYSTTAGPACLFNRKRRTVGVAPHRDCLRLGETFYFLLNIPLQTSWHCTSGRLRVLSSTFLHRFHRPALREGRRTAALQYFYHGFSLLPFQLVQLFLSCVLIGQGILYFLLRFQRTRLALDSLLL